MKDPTQRVIFTLTDTPEGGFSAKLVYEPSVLNRTTNSPSVNAAVRLALLLRSQPEKFAEPLIAPDPKVVLTDAS